MSLIPSLSPLLYSLQLAINGGDLFIVRSELSPTTVIGNERERVSRGLIELREPPVNSE